MSVVIRDWYKNASKEFQRPTIWKYPRLQRSTAPQRGRLRPHCMADIRIASTYARFAETFVKIGISPGDGGAYFLPRVISNSNAAEMVFTGELINATSA